MSEDTDLIPVEELQSKRLAENPVRHILNLTDLPNIYFARNVQPAYKDGNPKQRDAMTRMKRVRHILEDDLSVPEEIVNIAVFTKGNLIHLVTALAARELVVEMGPAYENKTVVFRHLVRECGLKYKVMPTPNLKDDRTKPLLDFVEEIWKDIKQDRNNLVNATAISAVTEIVTDKEQEGKTRLSGVETMLKLTEEGGFGKNKMDVNVNLVPAPSKPGWMMAKE